MIYNIKNKCKSKFHTSRISIFTVLAASLLTTSCSDFSDYNETPESQLTGKTTLWQNIISHGSLNNFAALIQKSGLDVNLKGANYYTILAPLDGTYDMTQFMAADSAKATEQFVKQHITNYGNVISGSDPIQIRTLNGKVHYLYPNGVTDVYAEDMVSFDATNAPASNGIMHTLKGQLPWRPNVYEFTDSAESCDQFRTYVKQYESYYIDQANSVQGPPDVNGNITYLDSTVVYVNTYYNRLRVDASKEDSLYTMVYLSDNAWNTAKAKLVPEYTYPTDEVKYNDWANIAAENKKAVNATMAADVAEATQTIDTEYLNDSVYKYQMTRNLSFSMKNPNNMKWLDIDKEVTAADDDTIITTNRHRIPGGAFAIKSNSIAVDGAKAKKLSNGYAWIANELTFKSWDTYHPYLMYDSRMDIPYYHPTASTVSTQYISKVELAERDTLFNELRSTGKPFIDEIVIPQLFDERFDTDLSYVKINPNSSTLPSFCVALSDVVATTYRVILLTVPPQVEEDYVNDITKKQRFSCWIDFYDGTTHVVNALKTNVEMKSDKFTYFDLGEVTFPYCYYGLDAYPTLRVQCTNPSESGVSVKQYESVVRLAGVLLIPKDAVDFYGE